MITGANYREFVDQQNRRNTQDSNRMTRRRATRWNQLYQRWVAFKQREAFESRFDSERVVTP